MKLFRRLIWPSATALGFLLVLAVAKPGVTNALPFTGPICKVDGPRVIYPDVTVLYAVRVTNDTEDDLAGRDPFGIDHEFTVTVDNISGSTKITGVALEDRGHDDIADTLSKSDFVEVTPTNMIQAMDVESPLFVDQDLLDYVESEYGYHVEGNPCGPGALSVLVNCIVTLDSFTGESQCKRFSEKTNQAQRKAWADAVDEAMKKGPFHRCVDLVNGKPVVNLDKYSLPKIGELALAAAGVNDQAAIHELTEYFVQYCDFAPFPSILDGVGFFTVTCDKPGDFEITISDESKRQNTTFAGVCQAPPSDKSIIAAAPSVIEIVPALGNVSHSFVLVTLLDKYGLTPESGYEVDFTTDRCSIETSGVDSVDELVAASQLFAAQNAFDPTTAAAIEASAAAKAAVDSKPLEDATESVSLGSSSRAAAILGCNPDDAPGATPGLATITAVIEVKGGQDVVLKVQVRVVGPPAIMEVAAAPASVRCGEKVEIKAKVGDSIGQFVSNQTVISAVTNLGGILGGTGAVAGHAGPVVPISSTVAETFDGVATFYLLTSELQKGPYEIVMIAGSNVAGKNGPYSTTPVSVSVQVSCSVPEGAVAAAAGAAAVPAAPPAPVLSAPRTGGGLVITPPNTGDGGLLDP